MVLGDKNMVVIDSGDGDVLVPLAGSGGAGWPVISPSGEFVAMITDTLDHVNVWDLETGAIRFTLAGHDAKKQAFWAEFSQDSSRIVTSSMDKTAIVWNAENGTRLQRLVGHTDYLILARFSPDGERIATASADGTAKVWNAATGELLSTFKGHSTLLTNVEFNPDPDVPRLLTTAVDNAVRVWDPNGFEARELLQITRDSKLVYATWSPDGRQILTCWKDGVVRVHETVPWAELAGVGDHAIPMEDRVRLWRQAKSQGR